MYQHINQDLSLSKEDLMKIHYPSLFKRQLAGHTFDYSIPQTWADWVVKELGVTYREVYQFVWYYSPESVYGEPLPLTENAREILIRLNELEKED
jgi:hypothetical protein